MKLNALNKLQTLKCATTPSKQTVPCKKQTVPSNHKSKCTLLETLCTVHQRNLTVQMHANTIIILMVLIQC